MKYVLKVVPAVTAGGGVDVLVNNAGQTKFCAHENLDGLDPEDWQRILGVNLVGPFLVTRAARELLSAGDEGGEVVMTSSIAGLIGMVRDGTIGKHENVLFLHTGGMPSLFAYEDVLLGRS